MIDTYDNDDVGDCDFCGAPGAPMRREYEYGINGPYVIWEHHCCDDCYDKHAP
jgi:hypothetical protein